MKHQTPNPQYAQRTAWKLRWIDAMKSEEFMWCVHSYEKYIDNRRYNCAMGVLRHMVSKELNHPTLVHLTEGEVANALQMSMDEYSQMESEVIEANDHGAGVRVGYERAIKVVEEWL